MFLEILYIFAGEGGGSGGALQRVCRLDLYSKGLKVLTGIYKVRSVYVGFISVVRDLFKGLMAVHLGAVEVLTLIKP